jgi:hypothetical protein
MNYLTNGKILLAVSNCETLKMHQLYQLRQTGGDSGTVKACQLFGRSLPKLSMVGRSS